MLKMGEGSSNLSLRNSQLINHFYIMFWHIKLVQILCDGNSFFFIVHLASPDSFEPGASLGYSLICARDSGDTYRTTFRISAHMINIM